MSFRGGDQARYGSVPPAQYPVAGQSHAHPQAQAQQQAPSGDGRRASFNSGDDAAYYNRPQQQQQPHGGPAFSNTPSSAPADELFMTNPTAQAPHRGATFGPSASSSVLSGYQHQYQDSTPPTPSHAAYNPQTFAQQDNFSRTQSMSLPYHPHPSSQRYPSAQPTYGTSPPSGYSHQTYNPAAYASASPPQRQASFAGYGSHDQAYSQNPLSHGQSPAAAYSPSFSQSGYSPALSQGYQPSQTSPGFTGMSPPGQVPGYGSPIYNASPYSNQQNGTNTTPYPATSHMPAAPIYPATDDSSSYFNRNSRPGSQSPMASPHQQPQASPGLRRHPTNAPLPSRPMDDVPEEPSSGANGQRVNDYSVQPVTAESIMEEIEAELGAAGRRTQDGAGDSTLQRYDSNATTLAHSASQASSNRPAQPSYDDDDDDPEGTAGVLAMRQAELDDRRFSGNTFVYSDLPATSNYLAPPPEEQTQSSDSELGDMVDLGMLSGGYAGNLTYGGDVGYSPPAHIPNKDVIGKDGAPRPLPMPGYVNASGSYGGYDRTPTYDNAEVDYAGTGGLQPPTAHRLSFDEGEEDVSLHSRQSGTESPVKDEYQDFFYHPGHSRPLPALPPGPGSDSSSLLSAQNSTRGHHQQHSYSLSADSRLYQPETPEAYYNQGQYAQPQPERSISLSGHSNTPQVQAPARSRTDAAEERRKLAKQQQGGQTGAASEYEGSTSPGAAAFDSIHLPSGRRRKFIPSKLTAEDFEICTEPWALSGLEAWMRELTDGEPDLRAKTVEDALIHLFIFKVATMNVADAEALSNRVVEMMLETKVLIPDEEWVKLGGGHISGVLWQLTGSGCYAPKLHDPETSRRCYSYYCTRTLKKVDLDEFNPEASKPTDEWHIFYGLQKSDWESKPRKEVDRQNILHEIVSGEENYLKQLDIFRTLYRDDLRTKSPPVIHPDRRDKFLAAVFGKLDTVLRINKDHLLAQLKYRQQEQGPWIVGFSDLFREWIRKAKTDYIEYATGYPRATYMVRKEADRNILFRRFLEDKQKHKSSSKQDWTHFLIAPLQRLQRYILLLESVDAKMLVDSEEKTNLAKAINEIKTVTLECDAKVAETNKRVQMMELDRMLVLRPGFQSKLNLDHLGRQLIIQGDLTRVGSKGVRWVDTHAFLFDHYLILAKEVSLKDGRGEKKYDVSREPIPMPLLFLESMNDEPIMRQKGLTAPLGRTTTAPTSSTQLNKVASNGNGRPGIEHVTTSSSVSSVNQMTPTSGDPEGKILYPFRIKHLGHEVYTLYASSARDRFDWCTKIVEAKTRHAKALFDQNAEPFRLRVLADASFQYDMSSIYSRTVGVHVKETPLDRAIQDLESVLGSGNGVAPVCRAQVNCATGFTAFNKAVIAIGTDYGVFISDPSNPRGWTRTVQALKVTQIAVLEEFSVCLIIADKSLISYPLDVIAPVSDFAPPLSDNPRRTPQRLAKDVTYFATGRMKDRMLVFYKRKESLHTSFKVLEPIYHKATEKKSRLFGGKKGVTGSTESFRDFDEFFFPTECYSLSLFQKYIAVSTAKGIEMLTLDKKQPMSLPDLKAPSIANIASRIRDQRPLGMFRLNDSEFLLTYEDCGVYVDKHGDVSRTLIMEYTGKQKKARGATMFGQYLLLINEDYVEVRNAENGRLRQIIAGRDVRVIDYGIRGPTGDNNATATQHPQSNGYATPPSEVSKGTVKIAMSHPELPGRQIVLEMLLNDGHTES